MTPRSYREQWWLAGAQSTNSQLFRSQFNLVTSFQKDLCVYDPGTKDYLIAVLFQLVVIALCGTSFAWSRFFSFTSFTHVGYVTFNLMPQEGQMAGKWTKSVFAGEATKVALSRKMWRSRG